MPSALQSALNGNYNQLNSENCTVHLSNSLALKVYPDSKPCNLKIASLQKGLIFVCDGKERIGEGTGFGFPVLMYPRETIFSRTSTVCVAQTAESVQIQKEFLMDTTARNKFRNVRLENEKARAFIRFLSEIYRKNRRLRFLSLKEFFVTTGVESTFVKTTPMGKVLVTYDVRDHIINVKVDFRQLKKEQLAKVFVLNEQSASFFRKYSDAHNVSLIDRKIGAWDTVDSEWACLTDLQGRIGYRLWNVRGSVLRRGRETMKNCLDWVGLDYEISPYKEVFEYKIEILGARR
jgi:hypothetical protein